MHGIAKLRALQNTKQNATLEPAPSQSPPTANLEANLEAIDLSCQRGDNLLFSGLSLKVYSGQCLHIIGANGSGKTSLLRLLCGINATENGVVKWRNIDIFESDSFFKESAYIGHKDGLKNELTALENLRFYQQLEGAKDEEALDDCLSALKILKCADLAAQSLSFGQRRRLAFARLLLCHRPLWILDEPFTGIDVDGRSLIEKLCVNHLERDGAIIMTHHQSLQDSALSEYRQELDLHSLNTGMNSLDQT